MRKILVTGSSGFIGTNLVDKLIREHESFLAIDCVLPKKRAHDSVFKQVDLCNLDELSKVVLAFEPSIVIHLGARTDLNGKTLDDYKANTLGVENLLDVLDRLPGLQHAIFASSMYVCRPGYTPKDFEDYQPHTAYGESKVETEKIIKAKDPKYTWTIVRPTSIWGPYFGEPYNLFFKIVLARKYFHLGEKACKKTYGYIDNFIYELFAILAAETEDVRKKVFYLGDYEPYDITSWANEIAAIKEITIPRIPFFLFKGAAYFGDLLKLVGLKFPMTSFRLRNMTTDNVFDLSPIKKIAPRIPVNRLAGTARTIAWMEIENK